MLEKRTLLLPPVEEIDRKLFAIEDTRDAALLWLYRNGLKASEAIDLRCRDLFMDKGEPIARLKGRGNRTRDIPLFRPVAVAVWLAVEGDRWPKRHDRYVITSAQRPQMSRKTAYNVVRRTIDEHPHILRHAYASQLIDSGVSLLMVRDLLGHENIQATVAYYQTTRSQLIEATKSVGLH